MCKNRFNKIIVIIGLFLFLCNQPVLFCARRVQSETEDWNNLYDGKKRQKPSGFSRAGKLAVAAGLGLGALLSVLLITKFKKQKSKPTAARAPVAPLGTEPLDSTGSLTTAQAPAWAFVPEVLSERATELASLRAELSGLSARTKTALEKGEQGYLVRISLIDLLAQWRLIERKIERKANALKTTVIREGGGDIVTALDNMEKQVFWTTEIFQALRAVTFSERAYMSREAVAEQNRFFVLCNEVVDGLFGNNEGERSTSVILAAVKLSQVVEMLSGEAKTSPFFREEPLVKKLWLDMAEEVARQDDEAVYTSADIAKCSDLQPARVWRRIKWNYIQLAGDTPCFGQAREAFWGAKCP